MSEQPIVIDDDDDDDDDSESSHSDCLIIEPASSSFDVSRTRFKRLIKSSFCLDTH